MSGAPRISVLIVTHNYARYLAQCLDSVLAQTFQDFEIILVDDGSTDETRAVAALYPRVRYVFQERAGVSRARNRALEEARGEFAAFLDADDFWPDDRLEILLPLAEKAWLQKSILFGRMDNFVQDVSLQNLPVVQAMLRNGQGPFPCLGLLPMEIFTLAGLFDPSLTYGEDSEFAIRCRFAQIRARYCDAVVLCRRLHGANLSIAVREDYKRGMMAFYTKQLRALRMKNGHDFDDHPGA